MSNLHQEPQSLSRETTHLKDSDDSWGINIFRENAARELAQHPGWRDEYDRDDPYKLPRDCPGHPENREWLEEKRTEGIRRGWQLLLEAFQRIQTIEDSIEREYWLLREHKHYGRIDKSDFRRLFKQWTATQEQGEAA